MILGNNLDLNKNQILQAVLQNLSSDPSSPVEGQIYLNTTTHKPFVYNGTSFIDISGSGNGTVTTFSVTTANGVSGSVATATTTPAVTITLGAITPTSVAASGTVTGSNLSGTNTGDQTSVSGNAGTATALATARNINGVAFDGTGNITVTAAAGTLTGATLASGVTASSLTSVGTLASLAVTGNITAATPTADDHVAIKSYVDTAVQGLTWKTAVRAATTANITLSGAQTIDGVSVVATDRVLVKNQSTAAENGVYVAASGAWSRALDANTAAELNGAAVFINEGTANADTSYTQNATIATLGTDAVTWAQFAAATGPAAAGTLTGTTLASNVVTSSLTSVGTLANLTVTNPITGSVTGNAGTVTTNANLTGDVTSSGNATTLATVNGNVGTFTSVTVNAKGLVTAATSPTTLAGYGITDAVKKYSTDIGDGSTTSIVVTHNLGTRDVTFNIRETSGSYNVWMPDVQITSTNTITLIWAVAPTTNQFRCVVMA